MNWLRFPLACVARPAPAAREFRSDEEVWHLTLDQIESGTGRIVDKQVAPASAAGSSTYVFDSGNVLYSKLRPYLNKVVKPAEAGIATTELVPLRPDPDVLCPEFLAHYLRSPSFVAFASGSVAGAKMPRVMMAKFWGHEIPLPPPSEQRRIVEILDQADRLRRLRAEADTKAERFLPALFIKMFGDPATNPKGWPTQPLGDVGELDRGRSRHRPRNAPALLGGPYPLIQTGDVANSDGRIRHHTQTYSEVGLAQSKMWPTGTLCVTIAANIAKTGVLEFDACFPDSIVGFNTGPRVTTEYVQFLLGRLQVVLERSAPQVAQKNINLEVLRNIAAPIPPIALQRRFSDKVARHYQSRLRQLHVREVLERLFSSTLTRAFSGELTARWREAHMKELLEEMGQQSRALAEVR